MLAEAKALSVSKKNLKHLVVGSDTIILFNNKIINKEFKPDKYLEHQEEKAIKEFRKHGKGARSAA